MPIVIEEMQVQPQPPAQPGDGRSQPVAVEQPPSPSVATAPAAIEETRRVLGHLARRAARVRAQ
ncbi:MAG: hypothetical protein N2378_04355 [Chloroflexaceae bacterium]|nr:hypothetical protein [Chloroflexaceae bacterium]